MCEAMKGCIKGCIKFILILINVIVLLAAIAMIAAGSYVLVEGNDYIPDIGVDVTTLAIAVIVLGVLLLLIGFFGCFGACTGKNSLLNVYMIGLLVIVLVEIAILIYGFVYQGDAADLVEKGLTGPFKAVNDGTANKGDRAVVDETQEWADCCGIDGPAYWTNVAFGVNVPASCCDEDDLDGAGNCLRAKAYTDGCLGDAEEMASETLLLILYILIAIIILQIICMIFACCAKED